MSERAKVTSIAALEEFRTALAAFADDAARAVMAADADIARARRAIDQQLPSHWKSELRRREGEVVKARIALEQALLSREMGKSSVDERKALAKAKEHVRRARERLEATQRWSRQLEREELIYRGRIESLSTFLQAGAPRAGVSLRMMIDRLEDYVSLAPTQPETESQSSHGHSFDSPGDPQPSMTRTDAAGDTHADLALIASRVPSPSQVDASGKADSRESLPTPPLSLRERSRLSRLTPDPAPDPRTFLLVDNTARGADRIGFHRSPPVSADDSGWRVLGLDRKEPSRWMRVPIIDLLRSRSSIHDLLHLPEGWTGVLLPTQPEPIGAILDANGADHWGSMSEEEPES